MNIFCPLPPITFPKFLHLTDTMLFIYLLIFLIVLNIVLQFSKMWRMEPQRRLLIYKSMKSLLAPFICLESMVSQQTIFYLLYLEGLYPVIAIKIFLVSHKKWQFLSRDIAGSLFSYWILVLSNNISQTAKSHMLHSYNPAFHSFFLVNCKSWRRRNPQ